MANPFYINHWNPIRHGYYPQDQIHPHSTKPKVINIPVHFVGSEDVASKQSPGPATASTVPTRKARVAAAVTIQRALRGFLVRKNARVVRQVAAEVDEIDRKLREEEVEIRLDARERLRLSETLMALLFRLDSVRGVRDYRKKVIRRVIGLQEAIDSISAVTDGTTEVVEDSSIDHEIADQTFDLEEEKNKAETELEIEIPAADESPERQSDLIAAGNETISTRDIEDDQGGSRSEAAEESYMDHEKAVEMEIPAAAQSPEIERDLLAAADGTIPTSGIADDQEGSRSEAADESSIDHEKTADQTLDLNEETNTHEIDLAIEISAADESSKRKSNLIDNGIGEDESRSSEVDEIPNANEEGSSMVVESSAEVAAKREEGEGMREVMEMMAMENENLKGMLAQLCATSAAQCRLMEDLTDRVETLERVVHRIDRRKKRRRSVAGCSALSSTK